VAEDGSRISRIVTAVSRGKNGDERNMRVCKNTNGDDWEDVVNQDSKLLMDFADRGGDLFKGRLDAIMCPVLFTGSLKDSFIPDMGKQNLSCPSKDGQFVRFWMGNFQGNQISIPRTGTKKDLNNEW
jgi:hypothetical protein